MLYGSARIRPGRLLAVLLFFIAAFSDFFAPNAPDELHLHQFYQPPSRIHFVDAAGSFHWRPFVYSMEMTNPQAASYQERRDRAYPLYLFSRGYSYRLLGLIRSSRHLVATETAGVFHPWGTDDLGRDVFARALAGARSSITVLLLGLLVYLLIGSSIGALSGMLGGWIDITLMRLSEFVLALPALYLVLAIRSLLPLQLSFGLAALVTASAIASVAWPPLARGIRGLIQQIQSADYAESARAIGASRLHILRRHMLPALLPVALAQAAAAAPLFVLGEVILSFLNASLQGQGISWGNMLRILAAEPRVLTDFWWNLSPLGLVIITLLCLNSFSRPSRTMQPTRLG